MQEMAVLEKFNHGTVKIWISQVKMLCCEVPTTLHALILLFLLFLLPSPPSPPSSLLLLLSYFSPPLLLLLSSFSSPPSPLLLSPSFSAPTVTMQCSVTLTLPSRSSSRQLVATMTIILTGAFILQNNCQLRGV